MQFSPSGGYRRLDSWTLATIAQLGTLQFCKKFLTKDIDPTGRQYDQMTQAARSGKVNIVEGSARSSTSRETEMKLTDVARASLGELHSDCEDWLLFHGQQVAKPIATHRLADFRIVWIFKPKNT